MEPSLCDGDRLRFDSPDDDIQRWEIVLLRFPLDDDRDSVRHYIKRVVGLPGETLEVRDGVVLVDGVSRADDDYALAPPNYEWGPKHIPEDQYFVLGDNRPNSFDSHAWPAGHEFVPRTNIEGVLPPETKRCPGRRQE
jgi:signal peptidase I